MKNVDIRIVTLIFVDGSQLSTLHIGGADAIKITQNQSEQIIKENDFTCEEIPDGNIIFQYWT